MRTLIIICSVLIFSVKAWSVETALYLSDKSKFSIYEVDKAMNKLLQKNKSKNILIFVHGRGKHPEKGLKILPDLEERYNVQVLMFYWDSWINFYTRPVRNAVSAGPDLLEVLTRLNEFKANNSHLFKNIKMSLLTHSMGGIVYKSMLNEYKNESLSNDLFDHIVVNQSDSLSEDHEDWLSKSDFQKSLYVTYNENDFILRRSVDIDPGDRLGLGVESSSKSHIPLAPQAFYIDLTSVAGNNHKTYFLKEKTEYAPLLKFFNTVLSGHKFELTPNNNVYKKSYSGDLFHQIFELRN